MKWILKAVTGFMSALPLERALAVGRGLGWVFGSVLRYHHRDAFDALTRSFPDKSPEEIRGIVRQMYANLGMNMAELMRFPRTPAEELTAAVELSGEERLREALARGKGVIVLTAHIGNWDLLCTVWPRLGYPLTVITKDIKGGVVNDFWMDARRRFGLRFVPAHNSYRACLTALKKNETVGFILDQNMIRAEGVFVDFFGRPACTTPGLAYMSAHSGAPVVPIFLIRGEKGRHQVRILPLIEPPPDRKPETIREFTQKYTSILEQVIREHPDQWIWIHRRWRTVPMSDGGTSNVERPTSNAEPSDRR